MDKNDLFVHETILLGYSSNRNGEEEILKQVPNAISSVCTDESSSDDRENRFQSKNVFHPFYREVSLS